MAPLNKRDAPTLASATSAIVNSTHVVQHNLNVCNSKVPLEPQIIEILVE